MMVPVVMVPSIDDGCFDHGRPFLEVKAESSDTSLAAAAESAAAAAFGVAAVAAAAVVEAAALLALVGAYWVLVRCGHRLVDLGVRQYLR